MGDVLGDLKSGNVSGFEKLIGDGSRVQWSKNPDVSDSVVSEMVVDALCGVVNKIKLSMIKGRWVL